MRLKLVDALPPRYRYGFWVGGAAIGLALMTLATSGSQDGLGRTIAPPSFFVSTGTFTGGFTLYDALTRESVPPAVVERVAAALRKSVSPRSLRAGDDYELLLSPAREFVRFTLTRGFRSYTVRSDEAGGMALDVADVPLETRRQASAGRLAGSLWESMAARDVPPELILQFADIFAWNVDFLTEPRDGDRFSLVYEQSAAPDGRVASGRILAARYDGRATGRQEAVYFDGDYYDEKGRSLRKAFLHAPLNFRRISSGFTKRRFHPVLRHFRPHLGIDYAAAAGTPVVSVGDGTVVFKGWKSAYGKYVLVRHNGTYSTAYGHFSRYAKGLRSGARVKQGQVIGYVGSTGWATGPHLDFRVIKNRKFVNFLTLEFPSEKSVPAGRRQPFRDACRDLLSRLDDAESDAPAAAPSL
jgi:murein DD-endopeptidase MepM/ murein hydrolase activator NlpD